MPYIIIAIVVILIIIFFAFITPAVTKVSVEKGLQDFLNKQSNITYKLSTNDNKLYHYDLIINEHHYLIRIVKIPSFAEVQINNKITWEVKYGAGDVPGKPQPNRRYLDDLRSFLKSDVGDKEKIVILVPKAKKIVKYINECEIIFVKPETDVYGVHILNEDDYKYLLRI